MKASQIFEDIENKKAEVEDLERGLVKLRGKDWETGINEDLRVSIKLLYTAYKNSVQTLINTRNMNMWRHTKERNYNEFSIEIQTSGF